MDVPVLSNSECNNLFKQAGLTEHVSDDLWVCAGYREGGKDACDVSLSRLSPPLMSVAAGRLRWASVSVGDWTEGGDRLAAGRHHLLGTKQLRGAEQAGCVHQDPQLHPVDTGQHQAAGLRVEQTQSFGNIKTGFRNLNINVVICICMDLLISNILLYNDLLCFFLSSGRP